jgi:hypothetical protein
MDHSTLIDDLPDNGHDKIINDLSRIQESLSDTSSDNGGDSGIDTSFKFPSSSMFSNKIVNYLIDAIIVLVLFVLFSNSFVNKQIFNIEYIRPYYDTIIGNSMVGVVMSIIYFIILYFKDS